MTGAAAERKTANARRPDDADGHGEPVLIGCRIKLGQLHAAPNVHQARRRIHRDFVHLRKVDHEAVVDAPEPTAVVPAATDRDAKPFALPIVDRGHNVVLVDAVGNSYRTSVDHGVEE